MKSPDFVTLTFDFRQPEPLVVLGVRIHKNGDHCWLPIFEMVLNPLLLKEAGSAHLRLDCLNFTVGVDDEFLAEFTLLLTEFFSCTFSGLDCFFSSFAELIWP